MRKTRRKDIGLVNEGLYDFYDAYDKAAEGDTTIDNIINYYLDKITKYGQNSLTKKEKEIFEAAQRGKLPKDRPVYKKNKVTGDIELDPMGNPVRMDQDVLIPGLPFITSKGRGAKKKETIKARCYWNVNDPCKMFYVYSTTVVDESNPNGLTIWKSESEGKDYGSFMKLTASELKSRPEDLWVRLEKKYDKGAILDKEAYVKFVQFDQLYHDDKKANIKKIEEIVEFLKEYPPKK